jgi:hypothetical protein
MFAGLVTDTQISDYDINFAESFIGISGFYMDFSGMTLGTVLFNISAEI